MNNKKGISLLATGHPYYGRMAFNLAMTIKAIDRDFPIAIIHDHAVLNHLSQKQRGMFDIFIPAQEVAFAGKLHIDIVTPFEETLFLDADMAWLPKHSPTDLFRKLKDTDFASITEGHSDEPPSKKYYFWADINEIKEVYKVEKVYQWRSEVMYFKKTEWVTRMFAKAREIYANPNLTTIHRFGQYIPDELAINIATSIEGIEPHEYKWQPSYWPRMNLRAGLSLESLYAQYYLLSCGSNAVSGETKVIYNRLVKAAAYKLGLQHVFPLISKKEILKDRQKV